MTEAIQTRRLVLRRFQRADAPALVGFLNTFAVARWLTRVPYPSAELDACEFIDHIARERDGTFAVSSDCKLIGAISTRDELGYWIGQPFWGHGFATEAVKAMIKRHFDRKASCLSSGYLLGNVRSRTVLTKLGFQPTGQRKTTALALAREVTVQKMDLFHADWVATQ